MKYKTCENKDCDRQQKRLHECGKLSLCSNCYRAVMNKDNDWCKAIKQAKEINLAYQSTVV